MWLRKEHSVDDPRTQGGGRGGSMQTRAVLPGVEEGTSRCLVLHSGLPTQGLALHEYRGGTNRFTRINNNPRISNSIRINSMFCVLTTVNLCLLVLY